MRIVVGMSGGVDSSLAAALLQKQGHHVIGMTLKLYSYGKSIEESEKNKQHCHPDSFIHRAEAVCKHLGIDHHVWNKEDLFQETIVQDFLQDYRNARTPLPCARCNRDVKTALMIQMMENLGADGIATGHYVRDVRFEERTELHQGADLKQDQSFFLFALRQEHLNKMHFPLGIYTKEETRRMAQELELVSANTPASQDLCFIEKGDYTSLFPQNPGEIRHIDGRVLGQHQGIERYTLGQRQGLGLGGLAEPLYVVAIDATHNVLTVGPYELLACKVFRIKDVNWLGNKNAPTQCKMGCKKEGPSSAFPQTDFSASRHSVTIKIRSTGQKLPATLFLEENGTFGFVELENPEYGVSPGQVCVFYQGTRVLGGGWIQETQSALLHAHNPHE